MEVENVAYGDKLGGSKHKSKGLLKAQLLEQGGPPALDSIEPDIDEFKNCKELAKSAKRKLKLLDKIKPEITSDSFSEKKQDKTQIIPKTLQSKPQTKSRYVLFVGRLPLDATEQDINNHFKHVGKIRDVRIPVHKETNQPRNFAYIEFDDKDSYEKAITLNHTMLNNKRINVEYTSSNGKKKENMREIKAKNMKLRALVRNGKFGGNTTKNQKRRERRMKAKYANNEPDG